MSGPYDVTVRKYYPDGSRLQFKRRVWYRTEKGQRRKPQFYFMFEAYSGTLGVANSWDCLNSRAAYETQVGNSYHDSLATNKSLDKFRDLVLSSGSATLANTAMEWRTTVESVVHRASTLLLAARLVRKGELRRALQTLGVSANHRRRVKKKVDPRNFADNWLEIHFGWVPLLEDIHTAINVLQRPHKITTSPLIKSHGSSSYREVYNRGLYDWTESWDYYVGVGCQARFEISNPHLFKANQLGLLNPASIAWEAVPFSFVVDWFLPVGNFLAQCAADPYRGLTLTDAMSTKMRKATSVQLYRNADEANNFGGTGRAVYVQRTTSLPSYTLQFKRFKGFSATRGATAISLLSQFLSTESLRNPLGTTFHR